MQLRVPCLLRDRAVRRALPITPSSAIPIKHSMKGAQGGGRVRLAAATLQLASHSRACGSSASWSCAHRASDSMKPGSRASWSALQGKKMHTPALMQCFMSISEPAWSLGTLSRAC